ncbi:MAG TPA: 50S ribosomal protein L24 [Anaeromyxobacteraceae bacterium]|jgi:large subunit ribosomal protein L24|nr:50S ribosomal protein L24 [Anaeromyxobacteraceae bacterium]
MDIRKNDTVKVLSGKEKGKSGKVLDVLHGKGRVRVEKLMTVKRAIKKGRNPAHPEGGLIEKYGTIDASSVQVVCPKCGKPTRVARVTREDGRRVRACKLCNEKWE